ncbi:MAG: hypothetical protein KGO93_01775 [Cyanobacteria bacterium REEB446]|nr:hypothetical protein [Cyanobacteria bacterium REEB446]
MSVDTASLNVTSSNYYRNLGAANNAVQFNRKDKDLKSEQVSEEKEAALETKAGKWEEQFKGIQHDPVEGLEHIQWGARVDHEDFDVLHDTTTKLVSELADRYATQGHRVKEEKSADLLSKLMLTMSFRSETDPDSLKKTQTKAFSVVSEVLGDLKGKISPDLREAVLNLLDPSVNNDLDKKARKVVDFIEIAGPQELVKKNSRLLNNIKEAFDVKIGGEVFKDSEGNSIGDQVRDLVKMYINPILIHPTDVDAESNQLGEKGRAAFKDIRTDIVNAAMEQAKDTQTLMKNFNGVKIKYGSNEEDYSSLASNGKSFKDYAEQRLNVVREYYIDPSAANRKNLIKHYADLAAEQSDVKQQAALSKASFEMLNKIDRKFNNIVLIPPQLMDEAKAKESLKTTAELKLNRIKDLESYKADTKVSNDDISAAVAGLKKAGELKVGNEDKTNEAEKLAKKLSGDFVDKDAFIKAAKEIKKDTVSDPIISDDALLGKIYDKANELKTKKIDEVILQEKTVLLNLVDPDSGALAKKTINKDEIKQFVANELFPPVVLGESPSEADVKKVADRDKAIEHFNDIIIDPSKSKDEMLAKVDKFINTRVAEGEFTAVQGKVFLATFEMKIDEATTIEAGTRRNQGAIKELTSSDFEVKISQLATLTPKQALKLIKNSGTDSYRVIQKDDDISTLKQEVLDLHRANNAKLAYLNKVETNLAKMFMDNFTRAGLEGVNRSIAGALEQSFIQNDQYTGDGLAYLQKHTEKLSSNHNGFVEALKMNRNYAEAQQAGALDKLIEKADKSAIGGAGQAVEQQISTVLGTPVTGLTALKALVEAVDDMYKNTNSDNFKIADVDRNALLNPDYTDSAYKQKQNIEARKVLLNFVEGLYKLTPENLKRLEATGNTGVQDHLDRVKNLAADPTQNLTRENVVSANNNLKRDLQQVERVYKSFLTSISEERMPKDLGKASGLESLMQEEQDMSEAKFGGKRFFAAATNFFEKLVTSLLTSASGGRRDTANDLINDMNTKHGDNALADVTGVVAESYKRLLTDPSAYNQATRAKVG